MKRKRSLLALIKMRGNYGDPTNDYVFDRIQELMKADLAVGAIDARLTRHKNNKELGTHMLEVFPTFK